MKRVLALAGALLLVPLLVRLLLAQSPAPPPSQAPPPPTFTLTDLGPLGLSAAPSGPTALNLSGQLTGFRFENFPSTPVCLAQGANEAFLWNPPPPTGGTYTELGTLGGASGFGYGINNAGEIAGGADICVNTGTSVQRAFVWQNGLMTPLDPRTDTSTSSVALAINTNGDIAGYLSGYQAVLWKAASIAPSPNGAVRSNNVVTITTTSAHGFAAGDPVTIAGVSDMSFNGAFTITSVPGATTFTYTQAAADAISGSGTAWDQVILVNLPGSSQGQAHAINDLRQAAGWGQVPGATHPVLWDSNGQPTDLGTLPGTFSANNQANAINSTGAAVGYSQKDGFTIHAFVWQSGTMTDLGVIPGVDPLFGAANVTDNNSSAWGINSRGDVVGVSGSGTNAAMFGSGGRAFLYTNGQMYDLLSLVAPDTNWRRLEAAWAINDNGQIAGVGIDSNQQEHGFLLTPIITPTTTALSTSGTPSVFGQSVSFTATVTPTQSSPLTPSGNVTFKDGTTVLGTVALSSGTAIFNTSTLGVGTHSITASYAGDNNFGSSTSSAVNQAVNQAATSTALAASPSPANPGQTVTFTATVTVVAPGAGTPTGTLTLRDGATALGTVVLNSAGNATFSSSSLVRGSHSITAVYGGDTNFAGSSSSSVNQVISQPATSTALVASPNPANLGQTVTFTATVTVIAPGVGTPTDTVTFLDGPTTLGIGVLSPGGTVTLSTSSLAVGSHTVTASYGGDATFAGSTSTGVIVTVQGPPPPVQITDNETIHVTDSESFPDVFDPENINVADAVWVTPLIQASAPVAEFSAGTLGFSGQSGSQTITVSDIGTASASIASATISGSPQFAITQIACSNSAASFSTTLPSGGACVLTIGYSASATPANDNGILVFTDNAALSNLASIPAGSSFTQSIPLSGAGSTTGPPPPPPAVIPIMDNETIHVTDTPSFPDVFDPETVKVADVVWVTPLIQVSAPVAEFSAGTLGFGGQSGSQTITVSDIGLASLTLASATISGSSQFAVTQISCTNSTTSFSTVLPSGGACVLTIGYTASATPANDNGTLVSTDNAALSNLSSIPAGSSFTQSIPLSGAGNTTGPPPPPPAVIPIMDNETIHVTDTPSFPDVFDPEKITVTDQVSVIPCDFTVSANSPVSIPVGGSGSAGITVTAVNGCNQQVNVSASAAPNGISLSLSSSTVNVPAGGAASTSLTVSAGPSVSPTSFTVTITGTSGLTHSASVNVNVTASISGTIGVVQTLSNAGAIDNTGIASALTSKLSAAQSAGSPQTSINTLKAFQNQVQAQAGQHIATSFTLAGVTFNPASTLMANGQAMIDSFRVSMIPDPITGYVVNANGVGIAGASVSIADTTGTMVASATTDVTGFYFMATTGILVPGANYNIRVSTLPSGFTSASPSNQSFTWQGVAIAFSNFALN